MMMTISNIQRSTVMGRAGRIYLAAALSGVKITNYQNWEQLATEGIIQVRIEIQQIITQKI